jgi:hypothetical protein
MLSVAVEALPREWRLLFVPVGPYFPVTAVGLSLKHRERFSAFSIWYLSA